MKLQELIDLKIVHDNALIIVKQDNIPSVDFEEFNVSRNFGILTKESLVRAGVREELFSYDVDEVWGSKYKFKIGIVIKKHKEEEK